VYYIKFVAPRRCRGEEEILFIPIIRPVDLVIGVTGKLVFIFTGKPANRKTG